MTKQMTSKTKTATQVETSTKGKNDETLSGPHFVLTQEGEVLGEDTAENRELVRRIHACVNACEGLSTEELEAGIVQDMSRVIGQVIPLLEEREQMAQILNQSSKS